MLLKRGPQNEKAITNAVDEWNAKESAEILNHERKKGAYGKKEGEIGTQKREEEKGTKTNIPLKAALSAGLLLAFIGVAADYTVGDAILAVLSLFGCYMVILSLFVYPNIKYRTARIVCGTGLVCLTAYCSQAIQDIVSEAIWQMLGGLFLATCLGLPVILIIAFIWFII